jgi:dUTP pyrophosphatase
MDIKIKILDEKVKKFGLPQYATPGSAGVDLCACIDEPLVLEPGQRANISTGIGIHIDDPGVVGLIFARSGLASKRGLTMANGVGVIDSDYTHEWKVAMVNIDKEPQTINPGDRIAQIVFMPVVQANWIISSEFEYTERKGGFGSTGV